MTPGARFPDPFGGEPEPDLSSIDALTQEVELQAALLTEVATGGRPWQPLRKEYRDRRRRLTEALEDRGLQYPFPWQDLGQWYGYWSGNLPTYASRRAKVADLAAPVLDALDHQGTGLTLTDPGSGQLAWASLDARLTGLAGELAKAASLDDMQDVGRRAREILIDCARLLADPSLVPGGQPVPKAADAKAWLDLFLAAQAPGSHRDALRRLVRAAWDLAQTVTHGNVDRVEAFAAAQATTLVVRTLQSLAERDTKPARRSPR
jgi:hypothetical protein